MIACPGCAWPNRDGALYCARCGASLAAATPVPETKGPALARPGDPASDPTEGPWLESRRTVPLSLAELQDDEPLTVGSLLQGRFQIVELLDDQPDYSVYRAIDLQRCGMCGVAAPADADGYCPHCGALRATPCFVQITAQWHRDPPPHDEHMALPDRDYYISIEAPRAPQNAASRWPVLRVGLSTDPGNQRDVNEDSVDSRVYECTGQRRMALLAVADGLGGHAAGEVASKLAVQGLWASIYETIWAPAMYGDTTLPEPREALHQAVLAADRAVADERSQQGSNMSSTLVAALIVDDALVLANVGDSRAYLLTRAGLKRITHDHSLVQRLVDAGKIAPVDVYTHPHRNVIYNSLGDADAVDVDLTTMTIRPDERLLLCSDGLWEMVRDDGIEEVLLAETDPQRACDLLVQRANLAGGEDNISVIVAQLERPLAVE